MTWGDTMRNTLGLIDEMEGTDSVVEHARLCGVPFAPCVQCGTDTPHIEGACMCCPGGLS